MNEETSCVVDVDRTYRYRMGWIFLIISFGMAGMSFWSYRLNSQPLALIFLFITGCILVAYIEWTTFFLRLDCEMIFYGSVFYSRSLSFASIQSVDYIFGKSSEFVVLRPRAGRSLTIWMYLDDFRNVRAIISAIAHQAGANIRERDKWGRWTAQSSAPADRERRR